MHVLFQAKHNFNLDLNQTQTELQNSLFSYNVNTFLIKRR